MGLCGLRKAASLIYLEGCLPLRVSVDMCVHSSICKGALHAEKWFYVCMSFSL